MKKQYLTPQTKVKSIESMTLLEGSPLYVDPGEEGNQSDAEARQFNDYNFWDEADIISTHSVWD